MALSIGSFICTLAVFIMSEADISKKLKDYPLIEDMADKDWLEDFKETPIVEQEIIPEILPTVEVSPTPLTPPADIPAPPSRPLVNWRELTEKRQKILKEVYHEFKDKLSSQYQIAEQLFNTVNSKKKQGIKNITSTVMMNPEKFFEGESMTLDNTVLETHLITEWNKLLSHGEGQIVLGAQQEIPVVVEVAPAPIMLPPVINPVPRAIPIYHPGSGSSSSAKPVLPQQEFARINQKRFEAICRLYDNDQVIHYSPTQYLATRSCSGSSI